MTVQDLDRKARSVAQNYLNLEKELLNLMIEMDRRKAFYKLGYNSLFAYVTQALSLAPATAYSFINVARKSSEVPELKKEVESGRLSISKAQKMTAILTPKNHKHWLSLAQVKTHRQLEREVALASPRSAVRESAKYAQSTEQAKEKVTIKRNMARLALQMGVSEKTMLKFRRAQGLESQRQKRSVSLEETLENLLQVYLEKKDPVEKAKRQKARGRLQPYSNPLIQKTTNSNCEKLREKTSQHTPCMERVEPAPSGNSCVWGKEKCPKSFSRKEVIVPRNNSREELGKVGFIGRFGKRREALAAVIIHQIYLRDEGRCSFRESSGRRCASRRFLEIHHILPVAQGGKNDLENLTLLCSGHHKVLHQSVQAKWKCPNGPESKIMN